MSFMADIKHDRNFWPLQWYYCLGAGHFSVRNLIWVALGRGGRLLEKTPTPPPHPLWVVFSSIWVIYLLIVPRKLPTNLTQVLVYREIKPTYFCDCCSFLLSKSCWFMVTALSTFLVWAINWFRAFLFSFAESSTLLTWSYEKENQSYGSIFRQIIDPVTLYYKGVICGNKGSGFFHYLKLKQIACGHGNWCLDLHSQVALLRQCPL